MLRFKPVGPGHCIELVAFIYFTELMAEEGHLNRPDSVLWFFVTQRWGWRQWQKRSNV